MKAVFIIGIVLLVLGVASLVVPLPHSENHGVKLGDTNVGVTTTHNQRVSPIVSAVLIVGGIGAMIAGRRTRA